MRLVAAFVCALVLICLGALPGHADKRVALVIGNGAYRYAPPLINPKNDAEDVGRSLQSLGFETVVATDLDRTGLNEALDRFSRSVAGADIAVVYYSGHGMQFAGRNYLLPVDARLAGADDVNRFRLLPFDDITDILQTARGARVIVLDACRNNPVEEELKRRLALAPGANRDAYLTRGLGRVSAGNGLIVAYETQASDVAADGSGRNSPFTAAFLRNVAAPDIDLRQMFFRVQDEVDQVTGGRQRPELSISLVGEFKLKASVTPAAPPASGAAAAAASEAERAWHVIASTTNQGLLEDFIRRFGDSFYGAVARARLQDLRQSPVAALSSPATPVTPVRPGAALSNPPAAEPPPAAGTGALFTASSRMEAVGKSSSSSFVKSIGECEQTCARSTGCRVFINRYISNCIFFLTRGA
jgi:uncharacterized caspase-like protein